MTNIGRMAFFVASLAVVGGGACSFHKTQMTQVSLNNNNDGSLPVYDGSVLQERGGVSVVAPDRGPCTGLRCQQTICASGPCASLPKCNPGEHTTATGTVYDPAGKVPLYNVTVYVPNEALKPLTEGASCDCETSISGAPVVSATTDSKGQFTLTDVPVGTNIPLVIQVGKWRREGAVIPTVAACTGTAIDPAVTRLPRNQSEGHIPRMALTTGGKDALECLLRKIGVQDSEFTPETGTGRVNLYAGGSHLGVAMGNASQGTNAYDPSLNAGATFTDAETWWEVAANLTKYDIILHSCEGTERPTNKSVNATMGLQAYANAGGRVFASHWHNYWIEHGAAPWPMVARFNHQGDPQSPFTATIDTTFPKGMAMSEWLTNVMASTTPGQLVIMGAKRTVAAVNAPTQRWIYSDTPASVQYFSFNAPTDPAVKQCGKVVFSDLHVSAGSGTATDDLSAPAKPFPTGCVTMDLSPQEKALEFMLFDLSTCVGTVIIP